MYAIVRCPKGLPQFTVIPLSEVKDEDVWGTYETRELAEAQACKDNEEKELYPSVHDYELAVASQTACNLTAIVRSFARVTDELWAEAHRKGMGTDYVNGHPISRLYAEQIMHLATLKSTSVHETWVSARSFCGRMADEQVG